MWSTVSPTPGNPVPCSRGKLAACVHDGHIYMLGGRNGSIPVRDFWKYSLTEHVWTEIRSMTGDVPSNLQDHTMIGWKGCLYVFGGEVGFASTGETPLWVYDIATNHWSKLTCNDRNARQPKGCRGHTAVVHRGVMYVYGGYRDLKGSTNELWAYDFEKDSWWPATYTGSAEVPPARHNHSVVVHDAAMWVYGGMTDLQARADFWKWDFVARQWSRVRSKGGPGELHGHTACKVLNSMVVFGGERSGQLLNEIWRFYFATDTWEKLVYHGAQPTPRSRHLTVVVPTLLLLLPHLYEGMTVNNQQQQSNGTPQHKQRQFQELVSSGSYAPSYSPSDSSDLDPPRPDISTMTTRGFPKSETISNCREVASSGTVSYETKISSSFSHTNFKFLRERISTSNLFKAQNATYMALSNSSESVQDDSMAAAAESGGGGVVVFGTNKPKLICGSNGDNNRTVHSRSIYNFVESNNGEQLVSSSDQGRGKLNNKNTGSNNRLYGRSLLSVPNFQKIQTLEMRGLMDDLSDSSSVDSARLTLNVVDNQAYSITPKKVALNTNMHLAKRHSSYLPGRGIGLLVSGGGGGGDDDGLLDNGAYCRNARLLPGMVTQQDSLENIPDIKDFDVAVEGGNGETASIKLIDLEAECNETIKGSFESPSSSTASSSSPPSSCSPSTDDAVSKSWATTTPDKPVTSAVTRPTLPAVNENMVWESHHKDYASCLNLHATTPDGRRWPNHHLELKTFPRLPGFEDDDNDADFLEECLTNNTEQCTADPDPVTANPQPLPPSINKVLTSGQQHQQNNNVVTTNGSRAPNSRHFSMLVLGGRENGMLACGRKPITVWKLDFWK